MPSSALSETKEHTMVGSEPTSGPMSFHASDQLSNIGSDGTLIRELKWQSKRVGKYIEEFKNI